MRLQPSIFMMLLLGSFAFAQQPTSTTPAATVQQSQQAVEGAATAAKTAAQAAASQSVDKPTVTVEKPTVAVEKPTVAVEKPTVTVEKPKVAVEKPSVGITKPKLSRGPWWKFGKRPSIAKPDLAMQKAMAIPAGSPVQLKTSGNQTIKGTMMGMDADGLQVMELQNGQGVSRKIPFAEISGLKQKGKPKLGHGFQTPAMLDASLRDIPVGSPIAVTMPDKSVVSGRFAGKTPDGLQVEVPSAGGFEKRTIPNAQISGIKQPSPKLGLGGGMPGMPGMPGLQSPVMARKTLSGIAPGSPLSVNMPGGQTLNGKLLGVEGDGFSMQTIEGGSLVTKQLKFDQIAGIQPPKPSLAGRLPGLRKPGLQTPGALRAKALNLPVGSPLTVTMPDGTKTVGKLMGTTNDGIQVQSMAGDQIVTKNLGFDQIGSIKAGAPKTPQMRVRGYAKTAITVAVTSAVAGLISGVISK